jgi:hypothetical protein
VQLARILKSDYLGLPTGAAGGFVAGAVVLLRRIEFGSPTDGTFCEPGAAWKKGSSLNPNKLAVITPGNCLIPVL